MILRNVKDLTNFNVASNACAGGDAH
jgi:hypothetical protein